MTFSERVQALTQQTLLPKVVDNVLGSNIASLRFIGNGEQGKGYSIKRPIQYQLAGTATSFAGLDNFTAALRTTKVRMEFDMRASRIPVAMSGMEVTANAGAKVTDLLVESLEESQQELIDTIGTQIYSLGTGNSSKDFIGLGAIVDDATDVATIGTLARSTYPVLNATRTASGGALTLPKLATLYSAISSGSQSSTPTIVISNETVWDLFETLLTPTVRETYSMMGYYEVSVRGGVARPKEGLSGTAGFTALTYKGLPWVRDEKATAQNVFMLNEKFIQWYGWDAAPETDYKKIEFASSQIEGMYDEAPMSQFSGFNWSGFNNPTNAFGSVADIILLGNLSTWQPRRQGRLTGVTSA